MECTHGNEDEDSCTECDAEEERLASALTVLLEGNEISDPEEQVNALLHHAVARAASAGYTLIDFQESLETTYTRYAERRDA
jgi:hypothetical protein